MDTVYFYCAVIGGAILVLQTILMFVGGDGDLDLDVDPGPDADLSDMAQPDSVLFQLSFKTVLAFVTFFGLTGMLGQEQQWTSNNTLLLAIGAGLGAFYMVGLMMRWLISLQRQGNLDLSKAVGTRALVYLRIPAERGGSGKVTVTVGGRRVVRKAITKGAEIPSGTEVVIDAMAGADTFEVSTPQS